MRKLIIHDLNQQACEALGMITEKRYFNVYNYNFRLYDRILFTGSVDSKNQLEESVGFLFGMVDTTAQTVMGKMLFDIYPCK